MEIELELTGFKLRIKGETEDVPKVTEGIKRQLAAALVEPAEVLTPSGSTGKTIDVTPSNESNEGQSPPKKRRRATGVRRESYQAIDFKHQPEQFGAPAQEWVTSKKAVWLLYVVQELAEQKELSGGDLASTFNKHFRQSGRITTGNVNRDLGKLKSSEKPAPVAEDTTQEPSKWYLTDEGKRRAKEYVDERLRT